LRKRENYFESSLRSKRFRRLFRPLEAFFAFWRREIWGERNTDGRSARPNFRAFTKRKMLQDITETLATQAILNLDKNIVASRKLSLRKQPTFREVAT